MSKYIDIDGIIKIYSVTFNRYTDTLSNIIPNNSKESDFIEVGYCNDSRREFLIREDQIPFYMNYGGGIKELKLVGWMYKE